MSPIAVLHQAMERCKDRRAYQSLENARNYLWRNLRLKGQRGDVWTIPTVERKESR